jgi:hypothetical protein
MKVAPLMKELSLARGIQASLIHTGQHYDDNMSRQFFADLEIPEAQALQRLSSSRRTLWIAGVAVYMVALAIVASIAVNPWVLSQGHQPGHVVVDGKTILGANGEPVQLLPNSAARDVTWAQLKQFLSNDQTDKIRYKDSTFVCGDFAETLYNNAEKAGINAGYVVIDFGPGTPGHACNAFRTTDRGIVYIDDTGTISGSVNADKTVDLSVGQSYCPVSIFQDCGYWACMGTVSSFHVTW